jgi:RNA polymerase sigma-70 factor (ECF subfamily)
MGDPEADLLERVRRFDMDALAGIYDQYSPGIYRYAMRLLGDEQLAEDCTADTFQRFLFALRSQRGPNQQLQAYLKRIAHNWITDHYRRNHRSELPIREAETDSQPEVAGSAEANIEAQRVRAMLFKLTPDQRQVILLKFYEGWENEEIARALQKPVGAVKALQHRAIQQLKKLAGQP